VTEHSDRDATHEQVPPPLPVVREFRYPRVVAVGTRRDALGAPAPAPLPPAEPPPPTAGPEDPASH
jgi:hypothetical protein